MVCQSNQTNALTLLKESVHIVFAEERLKALEESVSNLTALLRNQSFNQQMVVGEWVDEDTVKSRYNIGRSSLLKLRKTGKLSSSTLAGKKLYYRLSEIENLLELNAQNARI